MKKITLGFFAIAAVFMLTACTTIKPICATSNSVGSKVGESTYTMICGFPTTQVVDYGIQAAAKNGNITRISTVDSKVYAVGYFYRVVTTVVTGE